MASTERPVLLLLDGHSLAYRAFFALPVENFSTTTGQHTNAVYGFTSMLINVLRDETPTHLAVAFDVSRQTFRSEQYAEYKANRSTSPSEFAGQVSLIKEVLDALRVPYLEKPGFEADDVIGTLATQAKAAEFDVLICSGDRDSFQLVDDHTTVIYPMRGVSEMKRMTPEAVEERYGVPPSRYPELAAIVGETSDNLPGVPGVGQGFAAKWLNQYDGLEGVIANAEKITGKKGESLREHLGDVLRNRQLNALVCDLELSLHPTDLAVQPWDRDEVHKVFDSLEFRVLRDRLFETLSGDEPDIAPGTAVDGSVLAPGELPGWLAEHASGESLTGVEAQGQWGGGTGQLTSVALADATGGAAWIDAAEISADDETVLAGWLADPRPAQGAARREGSDARAGRAGLAAAWARRRHRPLGLPLAPRPALLRPGRPHVALPAPRAEERGGVDRPADLRPRRRLRARAGVDAEGERRRRPRCGARDRARDARRLQPAR